MYHISCFSPKIEEIVYLQLPKKHEFTESMVVIWAHCDFYFKNSRFLSEARSKFYVSLGRNNTKQNTKIFCLFSVLTNTNRLCFCLKSGNIMFFEGGGGGGKSVFILFYLKKKQKIHILFPVNFSQCISLFRRLDSDF